MGRLRELFNRLLKNPPLTLRNQPSLLKPSILYGQAALAESPGIATLRGDCMGFVYPAGGAGCVTDGATFHALGGRHELGMRDR